MAILAAATTDARVALGQQKSHQASPLVLLGPLLNHALQFQRLLSAATCLLFVRTYFAAKLIATALLIVSRIVALRAFLTSRFLALVITDLTKHSLRPFLTSRRARRFRKNLELELYQLLLGPIGYAMFLMLFWPGWLILALIARALWS